MNEIYRAIRKRYSSRNYTPYEITEKEKKTLGKILKSVPVLDDSVTLNWTFEDTSPIGSGRIYAKLKKKSSKKLTEYGFQGEAIVLGLTDSDHASCWMAVGKAVVQDAPAVIVFGKGTKSGILSAAKRFVIGSDSRKSRDVLLSKESMQPTAEQDSIIDAMRLAPSAINKQPWQFTVINKKTIQVEKLSGHPEWSYIDLGIVLYHGYAAAKSIKNRISVKRIKDDVYLLEW